VWKVRQLLFKDREIHAVSSRTIRMVEKVVSVLLADERELENVIC
jgi:hypothetical protein